jgi:hypothetical protein
MIGCLYGGRNALGEGGDDMVAPAYLFDPAFQLPLEERYAVAQVGDGLDFGVQQGVHTRLHGKCVLPDGDTVGGRRERFAAIYRSAFAFWLCGWRARRYLPAHIFRPREILSP